MMYFGKKESLAIPLRHWIKIEVQQKKHGFLSRRRPNNCYSHDPTRYKIIDTTKF
jgi:hypothetical protein